MKTIITAILAADGGQPTFAQVLINIAVFGTIGAVMTSLMLAAVMWGV